MSAKDYRRGLVDAAKVADDAAHSRQNSPLKMGKSDAVILEKCALQSEFIAQDIRALPVPADLDWRPLPSPPKKEVEG